MQDAIRARHVQVQNPSRGRDRKMSVGDMQEQVFLIGWPKSGTSSLFNWLSDHPDICGSSKKETYHFVDSDYPLYRRHGKSFQDDGFSAFASYFEKNAKIWLEGTTHTVFQETAATYLNANKDHSQTIAILREPARRIFSSFESTKNNFSTLDHSLSFDTYVDCLLAGRTEGLNKFYSSQASLYSARHQLHLSDYPKWIKHWQSNLGASRVHITIFDDMKNNPKEFMKDICMRLGLDPIIYDSYNFGISNRTIIVRHQKMHLLVKKMRQFVPAGPLKRSMKKAYLRFQYDEDLREDPREGIARLRAYFEPSVNALEELCDIDLTCWKDGSAG